MIRSFADAETERLFLTGRSRTYASILSVARRKLQVLETSAQLQDLRQPYGNHLESLRGDRTGQHSIRINAQYRICFVWTGSDAEQVEIVDYH